jgi:uncharacterized protein (TIGR03435 family)
MKNLLRATVRVSVVIVPLAFRVLAEPGLRAQRSIAPAGSPSFELASVKPNKLNGGPQNIVCCAGGRLTVTGIPLRHLIGIAYVSDAIQTTGQIVGGPGWVDSDRFDIVAKAEGDLAPDEQGRRTRLSAMLRALLEERFHVRVHTEMRDAQTYILMLANKDGKLGPALHQSKADCYTPASPPPPGEPPDPARLCGIRGGNGNVTALGVTMAQAAQSFANYPIVSRPVTDRTGLDGRYDWHIEITPAFLDGPNADSPPVANPAADSGPNLFTGLQEQLGLKLQGQKAQVEYIVIDHAEQLTPD